MKNVKKCPATGKVSFPSLVEAQITIFLLRWGYRHARDMYGKRVKHRQGRPAQKRAYYCAHCDGYHLTKWKLKHFQSYSAWQKRETGESHGKGFLLI